MAYNPGTFVSEFVGLSKPPNQIAVTQELTTPSYLEDKHMVRAKEMQGGLHYVKYKGLLTEDTLYDGIMSTRRKPYMACIVEKYDDDTPCGKMFILKNFPGNTYANVDIDWEEMSGTTVSLNNPITVRDLVDLDALTPVANDYANVQDGRDYIVVTNVTNTTPAVVTVVSTNPLVNDDIVSLKAPNAGPLNNTGIPDGDYMVKNVVVGQPGTFELYQTDGTTPVVGGTYVSGGHFFIGNYVSKSFVFDGTAWLPVFGLGGVDPAEVAANTLYRHTQGTDLKLQRSSGQDLTADAIYAHLQETNIHFEINDSNPTGDAGEVWSSEYTSLKFKDTVQAAEDYTYSVLEIDQLIIAAAQGIQITYPLFANRDADNSVENGTICLVDEDRGVYRFTGTLGQAGSGFWDFRYYIDKTIADVDADWNSPNDVLAPSQLAVETRIQEVANAIKAVDAVVETITDRDNLGIAIDGYNVWVTNASDDPTVDSGWALYKYLTSAGGYVKEAEQESLDLDLTPFTRYDDLAESQIFLGDENNLAVPTDTDKLYLDNVGDIILTSSYLFTNYPAAKLGQIVESAYQKATREQSSWSVIKKDPVRILQQIIDLSDTDIWNAETGTLNVGDYIGADILNFKTTLPVFSVSSITLNGTDPILIGVPDESIALLQEGNIVRFEDVAGTVGLNWATNGNVDFTIANLVYTSGGATFELAGTDSSGAAPYAGGGIFNFASGIFEPVIDYIVSIPNKWSLSFASHANERVTLTHYDEAIANTNQLVSNTNNDVIIEGSDTLRDMVTIVRNNYINMLYIPFSQNIKEQNLSSHLDEPTIIAGAYEFKIQQARRFFITLTENSTLTVPTLELNTSIVFTADITGVFSLTLPSANVVGDTYDGTMINRCIFDVYRKADGTQASHVTIENIL